MQHIAHLAIGENRGRPRIWLQGKCLELAGFNPASRYHVNLDLSLDNPTIRLTVAADGERYVTPKKSRSGQLQPVIDLCNRAIARVFGTKAKRVRVVYENGTITISLNPVDRRETERAGEIRQRMTENRPIRTGSLFTGGGILDHALHKGLQDLGVAAESAFIAEIEPAYLQQALIANPALVGTTRSFQGSVDEIQPDDLPKLDALIADIPCTAASKAGRAKKQQKIPERDPLVGHLGVVFLEIVKHTNPAVIVIENVPAYQNTASLAIIETTLKRLNYSVFSSVLGGAEHGALENRERLCLVGITQSLAPNELAIVPSAEKPDTLAEILENLPLDSPCWRRDKYLDEKEAADRLNGKNFAQQIVTPETTSIGCIGRGYNKRRSTEPRIAHPVEPHLKRLLTPREHARAKGIPRELMGVINGLPETTAHEILGQSVIWPMFRSVGRAVASVLRTACQAAANAGQPNPHEMPADGQMVLI